MGEADGRRWTLWRLLMPDAPWVVGDPPEPEHVPWTGTESVEVAPVAVEEELRAALRVFVDWFEKNDSYRDDFGEMAMVTNARALASSPPAAGPRKDKGLMGGTDGS